MLKQEVVSEKVVLDEKLENSGENPLGKLPIGKLLMKFAVPSIVAMIVNSIYNIVDQIFIQRGVGSNGNAATTVAFPLITFTLAIALLIGNGGTALASIKLGENKKKDAEKILGNAFTVIVVISVAFCILCWIGFEDILKILGASEAVMPYAKDYVSIILIGTVFMAIGSGLSGFIRADGRPSISMIGLVAGCALNIILDPIFIYVFKWGVSGAALATIISQIVTAIITMWYLLFKGNIIIRKENLRPEMALVFSCMALGLSSFITQCANAIVQVCSNNLLIHYGNLTSVGGDTAMTAMGIVLKTNMIIIGICVGIGTGAQPILGYNQGAAKYDRIKKAYKYSVIAATVVSVIGWIMVVFFPDIVLAIYGKKDPHMIEFAEKAMRLFLGGVFCAGFNIVTSVYFQAIGKAGVALIMSMSRQILALLPLIFILPIFFGLNGVLYAGFLADFVSFTIGAIFILKERKRLNKLIAT